MTMRARSRRETFLRPSCCGSPPLVDVRLDGSDRERGNVSLPRVAGLTEGGLSGLVFEREIGGHDCYRSKERILRPYVAFEGDLPLSARCACEGGCQREQPVH